VKTAGPRVHWTRPMGPPPRRTRRSGAGPAPSAVTGRLGLALQTAGQPAGEAPGAKRLAVVQQAAGGGGVSQSDREGTVGAGPLGGCAPGCPLCHQVSEAEETR